MPSGVKGSSPKCSVDGCLSLSRCNGWCAMHYKRWLSTGNPNLIKVEHSLEAIKKRFWDKVQKTEQCWIWIGALDAGGYGAVTIDNRRLRAHRVSFEWEQGTIHDGLVVDHLCRNRACVNPTHMEVVTPKINTARGYSPPAINAYRTECAIGHPFDLFNTYIRTNGKRECRTCKKDRKRIWDKQQKNGKAA